MVGMRDVAKKAGVSLSTVSLVVNGNGTCLMTCANVCAKPCKPQLCAERACPQSVS